MFRRQVFFVRQAAVLSGLFAAVLMCAAPASATTTVHVTITGLLSLGEASASVTTTPPGPPTPKILYLGDATALATPHLPVVVISNDYKPTGARLVNILSKAQYLQFQGNEVLSFKELVGTGNPLTYVDTEPAGHQLCPTTAEAKSLYFLPHLSRITRTSQGTHPTYADLDQTFMTQKCAASMEIDFGNLTANVASPLVWAFKTDPTQYGASHLQEIAAKLEWTFTISGSDLTLQSNSSPVVQMHADSLNEIRLTIANVPSSELTFLVTGTPVHLAKPVDFHFAFYYQFLSDHATKMYVPTVAGVCLANQVFSPDPCDFYVMVDMPRPSDCPLRSPVMVNGVNCGPDGMP